ncbi:TRAP transporter small permease [Anaeroselena agilis]|uniref:TRAP transporter small permease subunit n=1 Tax=Anaeroselena agilis TaxID=3063788 RepID=A0ABU3P1I1_9FIRM|nr:TRAP transporter small permease subunit [Selenomonadales bacterium 4137-cl]
MRLLFDLMDKFLKFGAVVCVGGMIAVVILQVYARALLPQVPAWTEEASRLFFIYTIGFAAGPAIFEKAYVNVDVVLMKLGPGVRRALELGVDVVLLAFFAVLTVEAHKLLKAVEGTTSAALLWPMEAFYGGILIMVLFVAVYLALALLNSLRSIRSTKEEPAR